MGFLPGTRRDTNQVCIRDLKIECGARPLTRRGEEDSFHLEIESSEPLDEKTELYPVDPLGLSSRGINKFLRESELIPSYIKYYQSTIQCYSKSYQSESSDQSEPKVSKENHIEPNQTTINDIAVNSDTDIDKLKKHEGIHCEKDSNQPGVRISTSHHQYRRSTRKELSFDFVTYPRFHRGTRCFDSVRALIVI